MYGLWKKLEDSYFLVTLSLKKCLRKDLLPISSIPNFEAVKIYVRYLHCRFTIKTSQLNDSYLPRVISWHLRLVKIQTISHSMLLFENH